ncbi:MAG: AtpZ/AtpI family protein [Syntrophomonadaceae bacterium]|nr:AtpZ/AtpI family protein [Syntrophomonadaceae bacterium]
MAQGKNAWVKPLSTAVNLGTSIAAAIALPTWIGHKLDERFGTGMLWIILGLFFGMATAGKMVWDRMIKDHGDEVPVYRRKKTTENNDENSPDVKQYRDAYAEEDKKDDDDERSSWW